MIKTYDGKSYKRVGGLAGDRQPLVGLQRKRALYTAVGGETSIDLSTLSPQISYFPGNSQISVKRSSGGSSISGIDFYELTATTIGFPSEDPLIAGEVVEVVLEINATGVMAIQPRPDIYTGTGTAGQTLVSANFSWQYNLNPSQSLGAVRVYLHGSLQARGIDYTEVNLGTTNTNQIQFVDALEGGENITILPSYQAIDTSAATSTFIGQQMSQAQSHLSFFQPFVDESNKISAPSTQIQNRAKIPNIASDLRASFGIDRIPTQQIYEIPNEFGANGERVFGAVGDDRGLVRFVGNWSSDNGSFGPRTLTTASGSYVEITFYGTGLNILKQYSVSGNDWRVSVDGGAEGSNIAVTDSSVINGRNYSENQPFSIVSGLSLGLHTVKIRLAAGSWLVITAFEVVNASSSIQINPGSAFIGGQKYTALNTQSLAFNAGVTGTRGGRQVVYLKADGTVGSVFQAVDSAQKNLSAADHTNEELIRSYHFREFGAGRLDDFSRVYGSGPYTLGFTMEDGTTTLTSNSAAIIVPGSGTGGATNEQIWADNGAFYTFTFVGTGLDILTVSDASARTTNVTVDGVAIGTITKAANSSLECKKIVSGLPYGTHTVKFTSVSGGVGAFRFNVYGPKKPSIPQGAIELADYNVMADFSVATTATSESISTGVLRKQGSREVVYSGTWTANLNPLTFSSGWYFNGSAVAGTYTQYTFFGTGCDIRIDAPTNLNLTITVDGSSNLSSYTTSTYGGTASINPTTGVYSVTAGANDAGMSVRGLPLGLHTVRLTNNNTAASFDLLCFDIITPVHTPKVNTTAAQNTSTIGSCSLSDSRKTSPIDSTITKKAYAQALGVTSAPTTTSTLAVPLPDLSVTVKTNGGKLDISYSAGVYASVAGIGVSCIVYVDGQAVGYSRNYTNVTASYEGTISDRIIVPVSAGVHKVDVYWFTGSATATSPGTRRSLVVEEI